MKQEDILKTLIKELLELDEVHYEYTDNTHTYVLDSTKNKDTMNITVSLKENEDKKEFEKWLSQVDDTLFTEVLEELGDSFNLESAYKSENYKQVINKVKSKTKEIAQRKIKELQKLINGQ